MKKVLDILHMIALPVWVGLNVLVAGLAVFCGYAGYIDHEFMPFAGVVAMTFPLWYVLSALFLVINLFLCRWLAIVSAATLLITLKAFLVFSPLNFSKHKLTDEERERSFKVLSYNVLSFVDAEGLPTDEFNRTLHTIIQSDADVLTLLEYATHGAPEQFAPKEQVDSFYTLYPYHATCKRGTALFSKRPILHIVPPNNEPNNGSIEIFRTTVNDNRPLNIIAVHLESFGLNDNDKELYRSLTDTKALGEANKKETVERVRKQLITKLLFAFEHRAWQAKMLRNFVEQMGGDIIICGDFNDVPGCRTVKILEEVGMKDAYAETAFGPTITFNAPYFAFRIDHVLWRGNFRAVDIERGNVASSDHYPMLTTFVWND